jgi:hypothetical protein
LDDLWKYDGEYWVWVSGSKQGAQQGVYGVKGVPSSDNYPGSRYGAVSWTDNSGNMWMFGGYGHDSNRNSGNAIM